MAGKPPNLDYKPPSKEGKSSSPPNLDFKPSSQPKLDSQPNPETEQTKDGQKKVIGPRRGSPTVIPEKWDFSNYYKRKFDPKAYQERFRARNKFVSINRLLLREITLILQARFKTKLEFPSMNMLIAGVIDQAFKAQLQYLDSMIDLIKAHRDPLFLDLVSSGDTNPDVRPTSFENAKNLVIREYHRYLEDLPSIDFMDYFEEEFKRLKDARLFSRLGFWQLYTLGLLLEYWDREETLMQVDASPFFTFLDDLLIDSDIHRRVVGVILLFAYTLVRNTPDFLLSWNHFTLIPNVLRNGYVINPWLRTRYGSPTQKGVKYENFLKYFFRSFGKIHGRAPDMPGGPREGFKDWLERTFEEMERLLSIYPLFQHEGQPMIMEAILLQLSRELESELVLREYDRDGVLISHPKYADYAFPLLQWLQKLSENREKAVNITSISEKGKKYILDQEHLRLIPYAIKKLNAKGEKFVQPWF